MAQFKGVFVIGITQMIFWKIIINTLFFEWKKVKIWELKKPVQFEINDGHHQDHH